MALLIVELVSSTSIEFFPLTEKRSFKVPSKIPSYQKGKWMRCSLNMGTQEYPITLKRE